MNNDFTEKELDKTLKRLEIEKSIEEKLEDGKCLAENEIAYLCREYPCIYEEEGNSGRYTIFMMTIVDVDGQLYAIHWQKGLTECQENIYDNQPFKCTQK